MSLLTTPSRRRAEEFAAALEAPDSSAARPEIAPLLELAADMRVLARQAPPEPHPSFSASLRERLLAEAEATWTLDPAASRLRLPASPGGRRERRLVAAATAVVLAGGTAGMATAAQRAMPGEALYAVKRGIEDVRTTLASDDAAKGRTVLAQAGTRLEEASTLLAGSEPTVAVEGALEDYRGQAVEGSDLLIDSYAETGDRADIREVRRFTRDGLASLTVLADSAPPELAAGLAAAAQALQEVDARAVDACPECGPVDDVLEPAAFEAALDAGRLMERLQAGELDNSHPLISRALRRAAEDGARERTDGDRTGAGTTGGQVDDLDGSTDGLDPGLDTDVDAGGGGVGDLGETLGETVDGTVDQVEKATEETVKSVDEVRDGVRDTVRKGGDQVRDTVDDATDPLLDPLLP